MQLQEESKLFKREYDNLTNTLHNNLTKTIAQTVQGQGGFNFRPNTFQDRSQIGHKYEL